MDGNGRGLLIRYFRLSCTLMCVCVCTIQNRWDRVCASSSSQPPPTHTQTHTLISSIFVFGDSFLLERERKYSSFSSLSLLSNSLCQPAQYVYVLNGSCCSCRFLFCNGPNKLPGKKKSPSFSLDIHIDMYACIYSVSTGAAISAGCV
jgi:hypothetical protein